MSMAVPMAAAPTLSAKPKRAASDAALRDDLPPLTVSRVAEGLTHAGVSGPPRPAAARDLGPLPCGKRGQPKRAVPGSRVVPIEATLRMRVMAISGSPSMPCLGAAPVALGPIPLTRDESLPPRLKAQGAFVASQRPDVLHGVLSGAGPKVPLMAPGRAKILSNAAIVEPSKGYVSLYHHQRDSDIHQTQPAARWEASSALGPGRLRKLHLVPRMQGLGWTQVTRTSVWADQAREIAQRRTAALRAQPSLLSAGAASLQERLAFLSELEQDGVQQGPTALPYALQMRCGDLDLAYSYMGGGDAGLTVLQLAGGLALLGLSVPSLCACSDSDLFRHLDTDEDGRVRLDDLYDAGAGEWPPPQAGDEWRTKDFWVAAAKFLALSAWFCAPEAKRRRGRPDEAPTPQRPYRGFENLPSSQWTSLGPAPPVKEATFLTTQGPTLSEVMASSPTNSAASQALSNNSLMEPSVALSRQLAGAEPRQAWAPQGDDLEEAREQVFLEFAARASAQQFGEQLFSRADFFRLMDELPVADFGDAAAKPVPSLEVGEVFDQTLAVQERHTALRRQAITKGLTFAYLRLALMRVFIRQGIHFHHLLDDGADALSR